jgi:meso-butanediol dehydrogenase/(S,S)-butanediol dehydrogenase/diacetyl reductase
MTGQRFKGRVAYITGAGSGVGRATASIFAGEGAEVFGVDVNEEGLKETVAIIRKSGGTVEYNVCDVSKMDSVRASVAGAARAFGGLHVLVNAAGAGRTLRFEELDEGEWHRVMSVNLNGPFHTTRAALELLLQPPVGCIVNVSSIAGMRGQAYNSHYCASKAGLLNFTRSIALEFATRGLRANCVCPGGIQTPFVRNFIPREDFEKSLVAYYSPPKPHQMGSPADIANVIAFLASDDARMINGAALVADFGTLA